MSESRKKDLVIGDRRWTPGQIQEFADHLGVTYQYAKSYIRRLVDAGGSVMTENAKWQRRAETLLPGPILREGRNGGAS